MDVQMIREVSVNYTSNPHTANPVPIKSPEDVVDAAKLVIKDDAKEHFLAFYLDGRNKPIGYQIVSIGTATASLVHPREILQAAVLLGAVSMVLVHTHPSGDLTASSEDREVTTRMTQAAKILGINLLDHVIISWKGTHFSMQENGMMEKS